MKAMFVILLATVLGFGIVSAKVKGKNVDYKAKGVTFKGYLAYDDAVKEKRPGIIVVHEWWGHNAYARRRADMLAGLGYVALAVDMYGDGKQAAHPDDAGKFAGEVMKNMDVAKERFLAAEELLKNDAHTDATNIGAIGYCFGGGVVLNMARMGLDLKGVASFHGSLGAATKAEKGGIKARILVCTGADDSFVPHDQVESFEAEMKEAGANVKVVSYPGAKHSFTNPDADVNGKKFSLPLEYNKKADKQSWEEMKKFFKAAFQ